jgi:very-short-patch-repair endonuclease
MDDDVEETTGRRRPPTHPHLRLRRAAAAAYGVSSRREAARLGVADSTFDDWCAVENAKRVHRGVVVLPDSAEVPERDIAAAILAAGPGAVAAGATAAYLHDLASEPPDRTTVLVPHARRAVRLEGVVVRRSVHLDPLDLTEVRRLRCTTVDRTLLDRVRELGWGDDGRALVLTALQRGATDLDALRRIAVRSGARRGRPLARLVAEFDDGRTPDSIFEHLVLEALRAAGLDPEVGWSLTVDGQRRRIDLAFPDARVAVECDGFAFHRSPRDLARDHERQNALVRAGWRVLRISWQRWVRNPAAVIAEIRELLAA